jgi:hypothetical protein
VLCNAIPRFQADKTLDLSEEIQRRLDAAFPQDTDGLAWKKSADSVTHRSRLDANAPREVWRGKLLRAVQRLQHLKAA